MLNQDEIRLLLERFREDKTVIEKLRSKYSINDILSVAIKNNMNDVIIALFQPIEINGEYIQFYDYYSVMDSVNNLGDFKEYLDELNDVIDIDNPNTRNIKLKNSLAREVSGWGHPINGEKDVRYYAEPACLESMLYLFRNNIVTTMNDTECVNNENEQGICKVWIRYDILSDENKEEVHKLIEEGVAGFVENDEDETVSIFVPCQKEETIGIVSDRLMEITKRFKKQISYRGMISADTILNMISKKVTKYLYDGTVIPGREESYLDLFYRYMDEGLIKPVLLDQNDYRRGHELVEAEEKVFSVVDFLKVVKELEPKIIENSIPYHFIYFDNEGRFWQSKEYYDNYVEEKKQMEAEKGQAK